MPDNWIPIQVDPDTAEQIRLYLGRSRIMPITTTNHQSYEAYDPNATCSPCDSGEHGSIDAVTGDCTCCGENIAVAEWERDLLNNLSAPEPRRWSKSVWQAPYWMDVTGIKDHEDLHATQSEQMNTVQVAMCMERMNINIINERTAPHIWSRMSLIQLIDGEFMRKYNDPFAFRKAKMHDVFSRMGLRLTEMYNDQPQDFSRFAQQMIGARWDSNLRRQMRVFMREEGAGH